MANEAQRDFWNGPAGDVWVEAQAYMDNILAPLSDVALERAAPDARDRCIDVGCGCGATTLALAESGAAVWGVDISAPMLAKAKARAEEEGMANVAFSVTDAATQAYTPDHDLVFSRFGVMFFEDPIAAFAQIRAGLKPGGRLIFICWQSPAKNPFMTVSGRAAKPFLPEAEPQDPRAPGPFAFADKDWVEEILTQSGYQNIGMESVERDLYVGADAEEAMQFHTRVGPMARVLAELEASTREQAMAAIRTALAEHESAQGVRLKAAVWLVTATN